MSDDQDPQDFLLQALSTESDDEQVAEQEAPTESTSMQAVTTQIPPTQAAPTQIAPTQAAPTQNVPVQAAPTPTVPIQAPPPTSTVPIQAAHAQAAVPNRRSGRRVAGFQSSSWCEPEYTDPETLLRKPRKKPAQRDPNAPKPAPTRRHRGRRRLARREATRAETADVAVPPDGVPPDGAGLPGGGQPGAGQPPPPPPATGQPVAHPLQGQIQLPPRSALHNMVLQGRVRKKWHGNVRRRFQDSLRNNGLICYRIAAVHCLLHLPEFHDYLNNMMHRHVCDKPVHECIPCALYRLFRVYWARTPDEDGRGEEEDEEDEEDVDADSLDPYWATFNHAFTTQFSKQTDHYFHEDVRDGGQSDSFHFFDGLLWKLEDSELGSVEPVRFIDMFGLPREERTKCDQCGYENRNRSMPDEHGEAGRFLSIEMEIKTLSGEMRSATGNLTELIKLTLNDVRETNCPSDYCQGLWGAKHLEKRPNRHFIVEKAPEILVVHPLISKFETDPVSGELRDSVHDQNLSWDEYLDLGPYTDADMPMVYRLSGLVVHYGNSTKSGHYVAHVRSPDGKTFSRIDDHRVVREGTDPSLLLKLPLTNPHVGPKWRAFILFYSKLPPT